MHRLEGSGDGLFLAGTFPLGAFKLGAPRGELQSSWRFDKISVGLYIFSGLELAPSARGIGPRNAMEPMKGFFFPASSPVRSLPTIFNPECHAPHRHRHDNQTTE